MKLTGAEILTQSFIKHHVDTIFGYPGACVISILDHLYHNKDIRQILVRHEQGAVHAACGYAQFANKPGVVLVTSGPGATNTITGIADAYASCIPLIVITGQVLSNLLGTDAFQEADMINITAPITKWNYQIRHVDQIADTVDRAFMLATSGCPGPVLLDIAKDVQTERAHYRSKESECLKYSLPKKPQSLSILSQKPLYTKVLHTLQESEKEIILVVDKQPNDFYSDNYFCSDIVLRSNVLGVSGFGLPAAIGARLGVTSSKTICLVAGVLEFQATIKELGVIIQEGLNIKIILLNNMTDNKFELRNPDLMQIAAAYGIEAAKVNADGDLRSNIHKMLNSSKSYILEINDDTI